MPISEKALEEILDLRSGEVNNLSVQKVVSLSFNAIYQEVQRIYNLIVEDHKKGDKSANEMYVDLSRGFESIQDSLPHLQSEVLKYAENVSNKISAYDNCIEILKKDNLQQSQSDQQESDLKNSDSLE